jgi:hypothetical protein
MCFQGHADYFTDFDIHHSKKFQVQLRNEKYLVKVYNYGIKRKSSKKKVMTTMVDFQQQSPQRFVDVYEHMNSRNDR